MRDLMWRHKYFLLFVIVALTMASSALYYLGWRRPLVAQGKSATIKVHKNTGLYVLSETIAQRGWVISPHVVRLVAELKGYRHVRFGEYAVTSSMTVAQLLHNMQHAQGLVDHRMTFIEGTPFSVILSQLGRDKNLTHTLSGLTDQQIMKRLGLPGDSPEGLFFPDTYRFTWGVTDASVLKLAYDHMQTILQDEWNRRDHGLPYQTAYQALIVASMIESETSQLQERPLVASVIVNRLRKHMRLQVDPTVMYGLGKPFGSVLTRRDLMTLSPYNTYRNYGLPPTPINMPSLTSLHAALHPAKTAYLYYVSNDKGGHVFSGDYKQHRLAVRQYRLQKKQNQMEQWRDEVMCYRELMRWRFMVFLKCFLSW